MKNIMISAIVLIGLIYLTFYAGIEQRASNWFWSATTAIGFCGCCISLPWLIYELTRKDKEQK